MNPSLINFYPKFLLSEKTGADKTPKFQIFDETFYVTYGIPAANVAGVVFNTKLNNTPFYSNTDFDDPDVTVSPALNKKILLPVDSKDDARFGDYEYTYKIKILNEIIDSDANTTAPGAATFSQIFYEGPTITDFISKVNQAVSDSEGQFFIQFLDAGGDVLGISDVTGAELDDSDIAVTFDSVTIAAFATITQFRFISYYTSVKTFPYCKQEWPCQKLTVTGDCIRAVLSANDQTQYSATDTLVRLINLNYPILANGSPVLPAVSTANSSISVGPSIWTGAYAIALTSNLTRETEEGLVLNIILTTYDNYILECDAGLCCMVDCISNLFSQYQIAVSNASAKLPTLTGNMIIINTYIQLYSISIECGDTDKAGQYLEQLKQYMTLIGCDCDCNDCGNNSEPTEVFPLFTEPMPNYVPISYLEANNITIDSNTKVPTNKAVITYVNGLLGNYYTESQIDTLISNYYTKTQIDTTLQNYYTETEIDTILEDYYTETEADSNFVHQYENNAPSGSTNDNLSGYISLNATNAPVLVGDIGLFVFNNNLVTPDSLVIVQIKDQSGIAPLFYTLIDVVAGSGTVSFRCNLSGLVGAVDDNIEIQFLVCNT
jgi:hypothetical protein